MTGTTNREVIYVSLGTTACEVSCHWMSLQGLACTTNGNDGDSAVAAVANPYPSTPKPLCHPNVTHSVRGGYLVPRAILVGGGDDDDDRRRRRHQGHNDGGGGDDNVAASSAPVATVAPDDPFAPHAPTNDGFGNYSHDLRLSRYRVQQPSTISPPTKKEASSQFASINSNSRYVNWDEEGEEEEDEDDYMQDEYEGERRARAEEAQQRQQQQQRQHQYNDKQVNERNNAISYENQVRQFWNDVRSFQEGQGENEGRNDQRQSPRSRRQQEEVNNIKNKGAPSPPRSQQQGGIAGQNLSWWEYWRMSCEAHQGPGSSHARVPVPPQQRSRPDVVVEDWDHYHVGSACHPSSSSSSSAASSSSASSSLARWFDDVLLERTRLELERCDSCQGVVVTSSSEGSRPGLHSGMATGVLQEFQQECSSARRFIVHVQGEDERHRGDDVDGAVASSAPLGSVTSSSSWHEKQVNRVRKGIGNGLMLHEYTEYAHLVLPVSTGGPSFVAALQSSSSSPPSSMTRAAIIAAALECGTLSFRLDGGNDTRTSSRVGLHTPFYYGSYSGGGDSPFGAAPNLTMSEFCNTLLPAAASNQNVVELDAALPRRPPEAATTMSSTSLPPPHQRPRRPTLWERIREGTSLERDPRVRPTPRDGRHKDVPPGAWMQHRWDDDDDTENDEGVLTSLTPSAGGNGGGGKGRGNNASARRKRCMDRSLHHHFALSSSFRPVKTPTVASRYSPAAAGRPGTPGVSLADYVNCVMEGMGIRYRPGQSAATVPNQSFHDLVGPPVGNHDGAYWNAVYGGGGSGENDVVGSLPILSVLGNTTRIHPYLSAISGDMKTALSSPQCRSYYDRDATNGYVPERDDCQEALSWCYDLRDRYHPPDGSGLGDESENHSYYDD